MEELVALLKKQNKTIASCESLTAGLFTSCIARVPGASAVLLGGVVTYATDIKARVVGVDEEIIQNEGVVSEQCAAAMAANTRALMQADLCVSFTGNAGPSCMEGKPAGCVYCALADETGTQTFHFQFDDADRNEVRERVVEAMRDVLVAYLKKNGG